MSRFSESLALGFSLVLSLALRVSLMLFLRCAFSSFYPLRCVLPSSYLLRCVLSPSCVAPSPRVFALRVTLRFLNCVACYPLLALRLASSVCASCLSIVVDLRVSFLIFFSRYRSFPNLFSISPLLSPISYLPSPISYLLTSPLSHIFPPLFHISFPLPYPISPPSPLFHLASSIFSYLLLFSPPSISFPPPIFFPLIPYPFLFSPYFLFSPRVCPFLSSPIFFISPFLFSLPIPSHQDGIVVLPGGISRPRWCNAQECMERPMSVYIRVYTFARPSRASSAVSSLSGWGVPLVARARIYYLIVSNHVKKASKFSFDFNFCRKRNNKKNHFDNIFFTCSIEFFTMPMCGCVGGSACIQISCAFWKYESALEYSPML